MIELLDQQQSFTINQWKIFTAVILSIMLDFFDFLLIGFVLAFFVQDWHLTYGQSALILFSSGVAAVPGAMFFGWLGDKIGRRRVFMMTVLTFSLATGAMALTPDRGWLYLAVMRFIVGFGVVGVAAVDMPLLQEFVPAEKRGWISGLSIALVPGGGLLAATFATYLGGIVGWRGLFALGLLPALLAFLIRVWVPESPRWLISRGRIEEARRSLAWALQIEPEAIAVPTSLSRSQKALWLEIFKYPRSIAARRPGRVEPNRCRGARPLDGHPASDGVAGHTGRGFVSGHLDQLSPDRRSRFRLLDYRSDGAAICGCSLLRLGGADDLARRLSALSLSWRGADVLRPAAAPGVLWQRQFGNQLPLHGRDVARFPARQRFRFCVRHIQPGEIHWPGRPGDDHRRLELRQPKSDARRHCPWFQLFRSLVCARGRCLPSDRDRDSRPHPRGNRCDAHTAQAARIGRRVTRCISWTT
jgi:Sugar (and other) transporter